MHIEKKIGEGAFADVYIATLNNKSVALKIPKTNITKEKADKYARSEISILKRFTKSKYIINLIHYEITPSINHIFIELLGNELYSVLKLYKNNNQQMPLSVVKHLTKQLLQGAKEMALENILHNDLKPENILFTKPLGNLFTFSKQTVIRLVNKNVQVNFINHKTHYDINQHIKKFYNVMQELILLNASVKISDFGNAYTIESSKNHKSFTSSRPTRHYISPEILLKCPFWIQSDMWSLGCIIYEMLTGCILFDPYRENNMGINSAHLADIIKIFGCFNNTDLQHAKKRKRYFDNTTHRFNYLIKSSNLDNLLKFYNLSSCESKFLQPFFYYNQNMRITPKQCLKSSWLQYT